MNVVASERGMTSHSDTLPITRIDARRISGHVLAHAVEDDDRVVHRVAEDR